MSLIDRIDAIPVAIPLKQPVRLASEVIVQAENLIVRVIDSDGAVGWGEAASAPTMTGERLPGMVTAVAKLIAPQLIGLAVCDRARWMHAIDGISGNPGARSAVDMALHDLMGKRLAQPLAAVAADGGPVPRRKALPLIVTLSAGEPETSLDRAAELARRGKTHFKVKVGQGDASEEANFLCALRERVGDLPHLSADANMAWDVERAGRFLRVAGPARLDYLEQPLPDGRIPDMALLAAGHATPLCLDESLHGPGDIEAHHAANAAAGAGLKLLKLGGVAATRAAEQVARRCGWQTTYACKIAETSIGAAAVVQLASLSADVSWGISLTCGQLTIDPVRKPFSSDPSSIVPSDAPGLGIEVDEAKLASIRLDL